MCGICGIIKFDGNHIQEDSILRMMQIQKHRGPDDEGVFIEDNVGLGFVRLSILDLTPAGHQPMFSPDKRYVTVFNGEIFNYIELRSELRKYGYEFYTGTDTEVLLAAYRHWGHDCLHHFNGMWAFVIYDRHNKSIFAARDRFGIKPFYYYLNNDFFAFASEIPPLLSLLPGKPSPDNQSIFDYLVFNRTDQTERTFFNEIKKLQHGHTISLLTNIQKPLHQNSKPINITRWYNLREKIALTKGFSSPDEYRNLFTDSIKLRLRSDVPVGVCLSGGLDSSSIVSVLLNVFNKADLQTFSAIYEKGQHGDETEFIHEYKLYLKNMYFITPKAETLRSDLDKFIFAHAEPIPSTSPYAQFKVMELAKGNVVVTLDGQGADEELAGYHYFFGFYFKELITSGRLGKFTSETLHYLLNHHSLYGVKTLLYFLLPQQLKTSARVGERGYLNPDFVRQYSSGNSISGELYGSPSLNDALINHFEYKLEHLLKWEDRNSMWHSIEARVPFLDYRLVEKTLATSPDFIIRNGHTKYVLRESMKGILPEKIRTRNDKVGFGTPEADWFTHKAFQELINNILNSKKLENRNIINVGKAKEIYRLHLRGKQNKSRDIWKLINLELWFKKFID